LILKAVFLEWKVMHFMAMIECQWKVQYGHSNHIGGIWSLHVSFCKTGPSN